MPNVSLASKPAYWLLKYGLNSLFLGFLGLFWIPLIQSESSDLGGGIAFGCLLTCGIGFYLYLVRRFLKTLDSVVEMIPGHLRIVSRNGQQSKIALHPAMEIRVIKKPRLRYCVIEREGKTITTFLPTNELLQDLRHPGPQLHWKWLMERYLHG